jgi:hypothetical protein
MERGSLQVRIAATGTHGPGMLAVPVPAVAQTTLAMPHALGAILFVLMLVLALAIVAIIVGALREATLEAGVAPPRTRGTLALVLTSMIVVGAIALGNHWWTSVARGYDQMIDKPWHLTPSVIGCSLRIPDVPTPVLPDHGHDMHLFLVASDHLAHLHPMRDGDDYVEQLPQLPAGHYRLYADIVAPSGLPITGTAELDLPELHCGAPTGDDSVWNAGEVAHVVWDRPGELRAGVALPLAFHVEPADGLEPYMGMVAHVAIVKRDGSVFAHLHPNGSVAMPALALAHGTMNMSMDPHFTIPFGFPQPGDYRVFVQIKRHGAVETAAFDATVK